MIGISISVVLSQDHLRDHLDWDLTWPDLGYPDWNPLIPDQDQDLHVWVQDQGLETMFNFIRKQNLIRPYMYVLNNLILILY